MRWFTDVSVWSEKPDVVQVFNSTNECFDYMPERTCKNKIVETNAYTPLEFRTDNFLCSECNEMFFADSERVNYPIDWAYCPSCGARVVSDDE